MVIGIVALEERSSEMRLAPQECTMKHTSRPIQAGSAPEVESLKPRSRWWMGVTTGVPRAGGIALAIMRGEMPTAHSACLKNCRFPHVASLNEDDGWLRRSLKPSIVSRLRGCHSLLEGEPPVESLYVHTSIGFVVRRMFLGGRLGIDRSKRTNIRVPRRF